MVENVQISHRKAANLRARLTCPSASLVFNLEGGRINVRASDEGPNFQALHVILAMANWRRSHSFPFLIDIIFSKRRETYTPGEN